MRQYRIIVSDGQRETEIVGAYASIQAAREDAQARGFKYILSIWEDHSGEKAPGDQPPPSRPPEVHALPPRDRIRPTTDGKWVILDPVEAARHPLYGVGGWLNFLAVLLILGAVGIAIEAIQLVFLAAGYPPAAIAAIVVLLLVVLQVWMIYLLFQKSPIFPTAFFVVSGIGIGLTALGLMLDGRVHLSSLIGIGVGAIWMCYMVISVRVNVTYKHRISPDDPMLKDVAPPAA